MHCDEADLEQAFSPYGIILEIRVKRSKETAKTLSYGFLEFASASSAVNAMNDMDGVVLKGRPLRIRWAASKKNPVRKRDIREDLSDRISMHVKFMSYKIETVITEELLRNLFSLYGEVCDTTIKQISIDRKSHRLKGYGFVSYYNDEAGYMAAQRALTELHDTTLDDITYKCELSNIIDTPAPGTPLPGPNGYHVMNPNNGLSLHPPSPHLGHALGPLSPMSDYDFGAMSPAQQSSYFDDFASNGGNLLAPNTLGARGNPMYPSTMNQEEVPVQVLEKSNSGGALSLGQNSSSGFTTNASMSLSSSKQPSRTSSLEKDSPSPGSLDFRSSLEPPLLQEGNGRNNSFMAPPSVPGHYGRSPGRAAISASPLLSSYQTVGAPLAGGPMNVPRAPPVVQRPYHHPSQQAPPPGQYPSQSRYQPNREGGYPSPQLGHLGVAGGMGGVYEASQSQGGRRVPSLGGSPQMPSAGYWNQPQGPPPPAQGRGYGSPSMPHSSPRGAPGNTYINYGQQPQQGSQPRYSPQQHYAPQSRINTQGLHQQPPLPHQQSHQQQQQSPLYSRYSPPSQYAQSHPSPVLNNYNHHGPPGSGLSYFNAPNHSGSSDLGLQQSSPSQGQAPGPGFGGGYNAQNRDFHSVQPARSLHIEPPPPLPNSNQNYSINNTHSVGSSRLYGDLSLDSSLLNNNNREGLLREDYFGLSNTNNQNAATSIASENTNNGWFPPQQDLPL